MGKLFEMRVLPLERTSPCTCTCLVEPIHPSCRVAARPAVLLKLPATGAASFVPDFLSLSFFRGISFCSSAANGQNSKEGERWGFLCLL